jgi:hypothetical protein
MSVGSILAAYGDQLAAEDFCENGLRTPVKSIGNGHDSCIDSLGEFQEPCGPMTNLNLLLDRRLRQL